MKNHQLLMVLVGSISCFYGCADKTTGPTTFATIQGRAVEESTFRPVIGALVRNLSFAENTFTDDEGEYSLAIELPDERPTNITLLISKEGFVTDTISSVIIQRAQITNVPDAILVKMADLGIGGEASSLVLVDIESSNIFVAGSGGNQTSDLIFEVRDKDGDPIDIQHQVNVKFRIRGGPGGGEFLSVDSVLTDSKGIAETTINSGTKAGALQIVAEIPETSIVSAPIPIIINGWLPDQAHFSVAPERLNFAGYNLFGLENPVTAFLGDKYSNPVPPGTGVQFQSTGGIIEGYAVTDDLGRAVARLISAKPQPQGISGFPFPFSEPGFALITAQTVDENQETIQANTVVLFSGRTQLSVNPTTFSIPAFGFQNFNYVLKDQNDNPLVGGTTIKIAANNGDVAGDTDITLEDTQSRAFTQFSFVLTNSNPDSSLVKNATVTIKVTSQNGNLTRSVTGEMLAINK